MHRGCKNSPRCSRHRRRGQTQWARCQKETQEDHGAKKRQNLFLRFHVSMCKLMMKAANQGIGAGVAWRHQLQRRWAAPALWFLCRCGQWEKLPRRVQQYFLSPCCVWSKKTCPLELDCWQLWRKRSAAMFLRGSWFGVQGYTQNWHPLFHSTAAEAHRCHLLCKLEWLMRGKGEREGRGGWNIDVLLWRNVQRTDLVVFTKVLRSVLVPFTPRRTS